MIGSTVPDHDVAGDYSLEVERDRQMHEGHGRILSEGVAHHLEVALTAEGLIQLQQGGDLAL